MKKLIISVLSVLILFNFIFPKNTCQASIMDNADDFKNFALGSMVTVNSASPFMASIIPSGLSVANTMDKIVKVSMLLMEGTKSLIKISLKDLASISVSTGKIKVENENQMENVKLEIESDIDAIKNYSIENLILGKYEVLDINFINGDKTTKNYWLKSKVIYFYNVIRTIAIVLSLFTLIYIGIRMTSSTIAEQKAKYKKQLTDWAIALCIMFLMHYIILGLIAIEGVAINIISWLYNGDVVIENEILDNLQKKVINNSGWAGIPDFIIWAIITYYQITFFFKYFKRMAKVAFLTVLSPIITLTYSLGDKSAFKTWFSELISLIFMPIIHGFIFVVFMVATSEIIKQAPILAIIIFIAMNKGEEIIRKALNIKGSKGFNIGKIHNPFKKGKKR